MLANKGSDDLADAAVPPVATNAEVQAVVGERVTVGVPAVWSGC